MKEDATPFHVDERVFIVGGNVRWRGMIARIIQMIGTIASFAYEVELEDGKRLVYMGNELADIGTFARTLAAR